MASMASRKRVLFVPVLLVGLMWGSCAFGDVFAAWECQQALPWEEEGVRQHDVNLSAPSNLCTGGWAICTASGGSDCDNIEYGVGEDCEDDGQCTSVQMCSKVMDNDDERYSWTITGCTDRIEKWSQYAANLKEKCAVETPASATTTTCTITITVEREEASTATDPAEVQSVTQTIQVSSPLPKSRTIGYNSAVQFLPVMAALSFMGWSLEAQRDDDMPGAVPGGADLDNSECALYTMGSYAADNTGCPYPDLDPWPGWASSSPHNVILVDSIRPLDPSGGTVLGCAWSPSTARIVVSNESPNKVNTLGHEWGHNGGCSDNTVAGNIMGNVDMGYYIGLVQSGAWACQTINPWPAINGACPP